MKSPSSSSRSPSSLHLSSSLFTPIQECEGEEDELSETKSQSRPSTCCIEKSPSLGHNIPTPFHEKEGKSKKRHEEEDGSVSCNKCRPHSREKISVVPLDNNGINKHSFPIVSPNTIFKSIFSSLTRKSPKSTDSREEQWKIAVAELSHKLIQATRKRDEAVLEASRLKYSVTELEKKLNKLEVYCYSLKSGLDECTGTSPHQVRMVKDIYQRRVIGDKAIEQFLVSVSDARSCVRLLSRSLTLQARHVGTKVYEKLSVLLQPYGIKISISKNPRSVLFYLEALLNKCFFEEFESIGYQKNSTNQILNPMDRCEANYNSFNGLKRLTWEEVLSKGTRHFGEEFSRFCDRKMSEIVAMLEWNRAWPEPLLQAFFGASKSVWLVHLLANSVHPSLPIFRVDKGISFDSGYMEDMGGDRARKLVPTAVRIMVAPGFYVYGNVVKCKVLCRYRNNINDNDISNSNDQGLTPSP
ncbi:hypothetical protein HS088_TW20G00273 [Tripterygium wilfordii]|uniref:GIL1/IRKI C-terminal domain-containing protein n=1 Tax=Tripterygium wilfordii TaxID=458696 RepID=A0A7J7C818_TRIWF|nr:IRK-interacting protein-like [Tripterygium wilfordii]KAF5729906.1 hypothetical protein HS088_TW20G00273 [Tripterygium wilfordii]